jgi:hypothetical protein
MNDIEIIREKTGMMNLDEKDVPDKIMFMQNARQDERTKSIEGEHRIIKEIEELKTTLIGATHRFWLCSRCKGWHYGEDYQCPMKKLEAENAEFRTDLEELRRSICYLSLMKQEMVIEEWEARWEKIIPWFEQRMRPKTGWLKPIHITDVKKMMQELESGGAKNEEPDDFDHDERKIHGNGGEVPSSLVGSEDSSSPCTVKRGCIEVISSMERDGTPKPEPKCHKCGVGLIFDEKNGWLCPNDLCDVGYDVKPMSENVRCAKCGKDFINEYRENQKIKHFTTCPSCRSNQAKMNQKGMPMPCKEFHGYYDPHPCKGTKVMCGTIDPWMNKIWLCKKHESKVS